MWMMLFFSMLVTCGECAPAQVNPAEDWLSKIEQRAGEVRTLRAEVTYRREQDITGDVQWRYGQLIYQSGPPAKFVAKLDRHAVDGNLFPIDKLYVYDGRFLADRDADEKIFSRYELAKEGEEKDLLALGEGPFAVPLNLKRDQVLERFEVELIDDGDDKPVHLVLIPREDESATRIDLWFDRETLLPVKARTAEADAETITEVQLKNTQVNPADVDAAVFDTAAPTEADWQTNDHPLEEGE